MVVYEGDPQRVASLLPGREYTPNSPLLHYTRKALRDDGWTVREHWWSRGQAMETEPAFLEAQEFVAGGGDHWLEIPDSVRETLKAHEAVVKRIDDFIRGLEN